MDLIIQEALATYNLPLTVLLGIAVIYWLIVIAGLIGMDSIDLDIDIDADADLDGDVSGSSDSMWMAVLRFLNFGQVPAGVVISILLLSAWTISMIANFIFNPAGSLLIALGLFVGNFIISALVTKVISAPLRTFFKKLDADDDARKPIVGRECVIKSLSVSESSGQAEIVTDAAPIIIQVRAAESDSLQKGDSALVVQEDPGSGIYRVRRIDNQNDNSNNDTKT